MKGRKRSKKVRRARLPKLPPYLRPHHSAIVIGLSLLVLLLWLTPPHSPWESADHLANQMVKGQISFDHKVDTEMYPKDDRWYLAYSPMVSLVLVPKAVLFPWLSMTYVCTLFFFGAAVLMYLFLREIPTTKGVAAPAMILYCLGTTIIQNVRHANVWALMHAEGNFFLMLALYLVLLRKLPWLAGLSFGIAASCRLAILPSAIGIALLFWEQRAKLLDGPKRWRPILSFAAFALIPVLVNSAFNYGMTGSPLISPYQRTFEYWGLKKPTFSLQYFWDRFALYTARLPTLLPRYPYLKYSLGGQAMWTISPFLLGAVPGCFRVPARLLSLAVGFFVIFFVYQCYVFDGYAQFGTRYLIDAFPYLIPLALIGFRPDTKRGLTALAILGALSIFLSCYGTYQFSFHN